MTKVLTETMRASIADIGAAKDFIKALHSAGLMWHFDDCAVDCLHETNDHLDREEAAFLNAQRDRLYDFDWGECECPIGYALHVMGHEIEG
jgi:hypothetical protein